MSNFRNVEDSGVWTAGNTYTFEFKAVVAPAPSEFCIGAIHSTVAKDVLFTSTAVNWIIANPWDTPPVEYGLNWTGTDLVTILINGSTGPMGNSGVSLGVGENLGDGWYKNTVVVSEDAESDNYKLFWAKQVDEEYDSYETYSITVTSSGPAPFAPPTPSQDGSGNTTGENNMVTIKRLVAAANSKIWYE